MSFKNKTAKFGGDDFQDDNINYNDINEEYLREMEKNSKLFEEKMKKLNKFQESNERNLYSNQTNNNNKRSIVNNDNDMDFNIEYKYNNPKYEEINYKNKKKYEDDNYQNNNYHSTFNPNVNKNYEREER